MSAAAAVAAPATMPVQLIEWRAVPRNTLRGFASVRLGRALRINDIPIHHADSGRTWCAMPGKPMLDGTGVHKRGENGKPLYAPVLEWMDRGSADAFSAAVVAAVEAAHPGVTA